MTTELNSQSKLDINTILDVAAAAVVGQFDRNKLLEKILELSSSLLDAEVCSIFLRKEEDKDVIECVAGTGYGKELAQGKKSYNLRNEEKGIEDKSFTGHVATTGKAYNIRNRTHMNELVTSDTIPWAKKHNDAIWGEGKDEMKNIMASPLKIGDQITGVIKIENKREADSFSDEEFSSFKTIGTIISLALENARLHQQSETQKKHISDVFSKISSDVVGSFTQEELFDTILTSAQQAFHAEAASLYLIDEDNNLLKCVAGKGFAGNIVGEYYDITGDKDSTSLTVTVYQKKEPIKVDSKDELEEYRKEGKWQGKFDDKQWQDNRVFRNLLAIPLTIKGECLGLIKLENKEPKYGECFSDDDKFHFMTIANLISLTIRNFKLQDTNTRQLRLASAKAAHRIHNQILRYDYVEYMLEKILEDISLQQSDDCKGVHTKIQPLIVKVAGTTQSLKKLVKEFGKFAKPVELEKSSVDFNQLIQEAINFVIDKEKREQHIIDYNLSKNLPELMIDHIRFSEAIQELVTNSLRALQDSSQQDGLKIQVQTNWDEDKISLIIIDNGPGLPEGMDIFEPFVTSSTQGTGLGLPTVKELVEAHGGKIEPETIRNQATEQVTGSRFRITLPIRFTESKRVN